MNKEVVLEKINWFINSIYLPIFLGVLTVISWKLDIFFLSAFFASISLLLTILLKANVMNLLMIMFVFFAGAKHDDTNFFSFIAIITYIVLLITIILLVRDLIINKIKYKNIFLYALFAWLASMLITLVSTVSVGLTLSSIGAVTGCIFLFIYISSRAEYTEDNIKYVCKIMIIITFVLFTQIIFRYFEKYDPNNPFEIIRWKGLELGWAISNRYVCYIVFAFITTMYMYIKSTKTKILYGFVIISQLLVILFTLARGAYLGIACFAIPLVIIVFLYTDSKKRELIYLGSFILVGIISLLVLSQLPVFEQLLDYFVNIDYSNNSNRDPLYEVGINVFKDNWFIGAGAGTSRFFIELINRTEKNYHNIFLQALADQGIVGLLTFLSVIITSIVMCFKKDLFKSLMLCMIIYLTAHGIVDTTFYSYALLPYFIVLIALALSDTKQIKE